MASGSGLGASSNDDPSAALGGSQDGAAAAAVGNQGSMQAESQGFNPSSSTTYQSQRGGGAGADSFYTSQSPSMVNSRLVFGASASLSPPPNLRGDLRRLQGLEYTEADMSLSALYMHEKFHRMSTTSSMLRRNIAASSRYEFDQGGQQQQQQQRSRMVRRSSLNEMDEENIPLMVDADGGSGDRLSASDMA